MSCRCNRSTTADAVLRCVRDAMLEGRLLPWVVEHARDADPLPKAWALSADDEAMREVLAAAGLESVSVHVAMHCDRCYQGRRDTVRSCAECLAILRQWYPTLTLARLLEPEKSR